MEATRARRTRVGLRATLRTAMGALLALAVVLGWGGCGSDSACPNGTTGSPCQLVTEPNERPEIPSAPDQDTLAPDAGGTDVDAGGDGNDSEDTDAGDDGAGASEDADVSSARRRWDRGFASIEAVAGNEARGRETSDTNADFGAVTLARVPAQVRGLEVVRRGAVGARTNDRETRDGDDDTLCADVRRTGPRGTPWDGEPAPHHQRVV